MVSLKIKLDNLSDYPGENIRAREKEVLEEMYKQAPGAARKYVLSEVRNLHFNQFLEQLENYMLYPLASAKKGIINFGRIVSSLDIDKFKRNLEQTLNMFRYSC